MKMKLARVALLWLCIIENHPLLILLIIVLNLICVILFDYLINRAKFYQAESKNE